MVSAAGSWQQGGRVDGRDIIEWSVVVQQRVVGADGVADEG
jgi:hypothetical protein